MKKVLSLIVVSFIFLSQSVFASTAKVHIKGMVCSACTKSISATLQSKPQVKNVAIDLETGVATVDLLEKSKMTDAELKKAIESLGYEVAKIDRT